MLDFEEGRFLRAVKNVSVNEPFFQCYFPGKPIFPGVLILEAMAQATGILAFKSVGKLEPGELYYFAGIRSALQAPGRAWRSNDHGSHFRKRAAA